MPGKSRSGHRTKPPFDSDADVPVEIGKGDVRRMSILFSRTYVVPTGCIVVGLLALSAPMPVAGVLLLCAVVGATAVMIISARLSGPNDRAAQHLATVASTARQASGKR
jgi:hypothetical protein